MDQSSMARHKKKARALKATIVFADESGFSLIPFVAKTWAKRGETPIFKHAFRWPKISAISAIAIPNQLLFMVVEGAVQAYHCQKFLIHLLRHVKGPVTVIWDNNNTHKSKDVLEIVKSSHGSLIIEYLPPYAADLNADEFVWNHLKKNELPNFAAKDIDQLKRGLRLAVVRTRRRKGLIRGFFHGTPLCMDGVLNH